MIFQILDDKRDCNGFYVNGEFRYEKDIKNIDGTWGYSDILRDKHIRYAYLWGSGKNIRDICPEHLKNRFEISEKRIKAQYKSFVKSKINFQDICFYEVVPEKQLRHYFQVKNEICQWVFDNIEKLS